MVLATWSNVPTRNPTNLSSSPSYVVLRLLMNGLDHLCDLTLGCRGL